MAIKRSLTSTSRAVQEDMHNINIALLFLFVWSFIRTWNQGTISDANKIHGVNPGEPVLGYYGFQGCCYSHYDDWYPLYMNRSDLWLKDDSGTIVIWNDDGPPITPFFDFCNPDLVTFFKDKILSDFMNSDAISGVFFDECDAFVDGPQAFWNPNGYGYDFSVTSQNKVRECYINGMVNITKYISSFNKWIIPSSYSLSKQSSEWENAMDNALLEYGGFRYIEYLECWGNGKIYNVSDAEKWNEIIETNGFGTQEWKQLLLTDMNNNHVRSNGIDGSFDCYAYDTVEACCQDMILTSLNVAKKGVPIMIRAQQNRKEYNQRYYATAAFLVMAYEYSYFAGGNGWSGTESFPWFDIYNYPIGEPQ
eukprot:447629_1